MYIAMNRFKIKLGCEQDFIDVWRNRDSQLGSVAGFVSFNLLQGASNAEFTLISSHATWKSKQAFKAWTQSEAFKKAHVGAGNSRDMHAGRPQLECFEVVI